MAGKKKVKYPRYRRRMRQVYSHRSRRKKNLRELKASEKAFNKAVTPAKGKLIKRLTPKERKIFDRFIQTATNAGQNQRAAWKHRAIAPFSKLRDRFDNLRK